MKKIQMIDLGTQYQEMASQIDQAVLNVIRSTAFINGPEVKSFQAELEQFLGVKHVIPCANGTDALQIAMMALDFVPGDEIIVPTFTYVATAEVIGLLRLTPVLVDVEPDTFNVDPAKIEAAITPKTKAIVPVHLFGQCANMDAIMDIAKRHNLHVIEDNAQAIGADYTGRDGTRKAGTIGTIGCTSFYPSKNLAAYGDGGAIFTNSDDLAHKMRQIANHGQSTLYYFERIGVNSRLDSIQAAILRIQLSRLGEYTQKRQALAAAYDKAFAGNAKLVTPKKAGYSTHVYHQYTLQLKGVNRDALKTYLAEQGIPSMVYYPVPLHQQKAYLDPRYKDGDFPVSERLSAEVISLPMQTSLDDEQVAHITKHVLQFVNQA